MVARDIPLAHRTKTLHYMSSSLIVLPPQIHSAMSLGQYQKTTVKLLEADYRPRRSMVLHGSIHNLYALLPMVVKMYRSVFLYRPVCTTINITPLIIRLAPATSILSIKSTSSPWSNRTSINSYESMVTKPL